MRSDWNTEQLEIINGGVSSAVDPRLIQNNQAAWAMNMVMRGGNPHTRPSFRYCMELPAGLYQGAGYFSIQGGMFVASIAGQLYRLRIGDNAFSAESITLDYKNSGTRNKAWFCQTVETMIVQDGESYPILYDGNVAKRSDVTGLKTYNELYDPDATDAENEANLIPQVPIGQQMAYGNGRLWVAQGGYNVVAGDIRTDEVGSELLFTENQYLTGGGALYFADGINGMGFIPTTGGGDTGSLVIFGKSSSDTIRADVTNRDQWQVIPGFVAPAFRGIGACGHESVVPINQDLYWRDQYGNVRSLRNAAADEQGAGNAPLSREVSRVTDYESDKYLSQSSSILADNRLLFTSNPFLLGNGGIGYKTITSLDFANISTMQGRTAPAYDGIWTGLDFVQLLSGTFHGRKRYFVVSHHEDGLYRLWEIVDTRNDITSILGTTTQSRIVSYVEYGRKAFGDVRSRKRLERFDVYLADVDGPVDVDVYWRADNSSKWQKWDATAAEVCAKTTDSSTTAPHSWKLLKPQQRPQLKTYTIPTRYNSITGFQEHVGFEFQFKVVITGRCRIYRALAHAVMVPQTPYNDDVTSTCIEEDLTGGGITYEIPFTREPSPGLLFFLNDKTYGNDGSIQLLTDPGSSVTLAAVLDNEDHSIPTTVFKVLCTWADSTIGKNAMMDQVFYPFQVPGDPVVNPALFIKLDNLTGDDEFDVDIYNDSTTPIFSIHFKTFRIRATYDTMGIYSVLTSTINRNITYNSESVIEKLGVDNVLSSTINRNVRYSQTLTPEIVGVNNVLATTVNFRSKVAGPSDVEPIGLHCELATSIYFNALVSRTLTAEQIGITNVLSTTSYSS